ncbi:MAG: aldo/keto reductase [Kofleriaceae bacterium]|nr:aldo/keto reductase [Kofleriaceae bacterium]
METRRAGRLGRSIPVIGFGGRALGPPPPRGDRDGPRLEPRDAQRALAAAIEAGVELVDVAPAWGDAEALAGETIRALRGRDRVVLATLVPDAPPPPGATPRPPRPGPDGSTPAPALERVLPAAWVQRAVEASLRATRLEVLPLAWLPWRGGWLTASAWPELRGAMARLVREGKVLTWGAHLPDVPPDDVAALLDAAPVAAIQVALDLEHRAAAAVLDATATREVAVIVRRPLAGGALTGDVGDLGGVPRARWRDEVADRADLALRWVLGHAAVTAALVGARTLDHVRAAIAAGDGRALSPPLREALDAGDT